MTAAEAQALCGASSGAVGDRSSGALITIPDDPVADRRSLEALGRWLTRFTPVVACAGEQGGDPAAFIPALFLDVTGCERLFGGMTRLTNLVAQALQRFGIPARLAVAPTVGSAWAFAVTPLAGHTADRSATDRNAINRNAINRGVVDQKIGNCPIIEPAALADAVGPLPVGVLRLPEAVLADLIHLGLLRVRDVMALPRDALPARFGPLLLKRVDQLLGTTPEPLAKLVYDPPVTVRHEFEAPIESPETVGLIFEQLLDEVLLDLARRNRGVRSLRMILTPDRGWGRPTVTREITLSRAHAHLPTLRELIGREIERIDCEHGFTRFRIDVPRHEAMTQLQTQFFDGPSPDDMQFERLLQRLRARLGDQEVIWPEPVESYLPERAWRPASDEAVDAAAFDAAEAEATGLSTAVTSSPATHAATHTMTTAAPAPPRPLTLMPDPSEILVMCEPSDDRTGQPRQFTWRGEVHRLTHVIGPERIAGEWWRGHRRTRDYYEVEDEPGRRFWIFRVLGVRAPDRIIARWFLHGKFD